MIIDKWQWEANPFTNLNFGKWEIRIPALSDGSCAIHHLSEVKIIIRTKSGQLVSRLSPWAKYVVQPPKEANQGTNYKQIVWNPPPHDVRKSTCVEFLSRASFYLKIVLFRTIKRFHFKNRKPNRPKGLKIYECHVGIATEKLGVGSYDNFRENILPRIVRQGYNAVQIMAIMEHAYYASFGYQVTSFYAASSRYGTPDALKRLVDEAHRLGLFVLLDVVHSHASKNVEDGLNQFDGTNSCFFHDGARGEHILWDSRLFNYTEYEVLRFLLSNLRWWHDEYNFDGIWPPQSY